VLLEGYYDHVEEDGYDLCDVARRVKKDERETEDFTCTMAH
jgi:hypothetical protein